MLDAGLHAYFVFAANPGFDPGSVLSDSCHHAYGCPFFPLNPGSSPYIGNLSEPKT